MRGDKGINNLTWVYKLIATKFVGVGAKVVVRICLFSLLLTMLYNDKSSWKMTRLILIDPNLHMSYTNWEHHTKIILIIFI